MNKMTGAVIAAMATMIAGWGSGASAMVRYDVLYAPAFGFTYGFSYTAADFIASDVVIPGASLDSCTAGCSSADFFTSGTEDVVILEAPYPGGSVELGAGFAIGTFGVPGTYKDNLGNMLTITNLNPSAAPEPASWTMMLVGFGGMGAALRARRRAVLAA